MKPTTPAARVESRLASVRRTIRRVQWLRALAIVATAFFGGLVAMMAADWLFAPLATGLRVALFVAWLLAVLAAVVLGSRPLRRKISLVQVARWLEVRHPDLEERLSTVMEISDPGSGLLEELARAAGEDAGKLDPRKEVAAVRTTRRWARPALAALLVLVVALVVWPAETSRLLVRAVAPFSATGNAGAGDFQIVPGDLEVLEGDAIEIAIRHEGEAEKIELRMDFDDGPQVAQWLGRDNGTFRYILDPARRSFTYRARSGRAESDAFRATVWPLPEITGPRLRLESPEYTGVAPEERPAEDAVEAVAGTVVTLSGALTTPVEEAWLSIGGERIAANAGGLPLSWTLAAGGSGEAVVTLRHRLGREIEALRFHVTVLEDEPPQVDWIAPAARDLRVRPDEVLRGIFEAADDFGIVRTALEVEGPEGSDVLDRPVPARAADSKPPIYRGTLDLSVGELRERFGGPELRLRVLAEDARPEPLGGPGRGHSEWLDLRIDEGAESLVRQDIRQQQDHTRQALDRAIGAVREARDQVERQRHEVRQDELRPEARQQLQEAADRLAEAQQALDELGVRMDDGVHAAKADEVRETSETLDQARRAAEEAPLHDDPARREATLDEAKSQADEALADLEEMRRAIDRDHRKLEDLAYLAELAQRQRELARQAQAEVPDDWRDRQRQMEDALRQQVRQRPEARAEALRAQADEASALAEEAREIAAEQQALAEGVPESADASHAAARAEAASREMADLPRIEHQGALQEAAQAASTGAERASEASRAEPDEAASQHAEAGRDFQRGAEALERAAAEMAAAAGEAAGQPADPGRLPVPASELAEAFQEAAGAASSPATDQAAGHATRAADALERAMQAGMEQLRGQPGPPSAEPGDEPREGPRQAQGDPGMPPELAKLGISAGDWEKIQASLRADVSAADADAVPAEYRELVRRYFETIAEGTDDR